MADDFLQLSSQDRRDALGVAADLFGRPARPLEKDVWMFWRWQRSMQCRSASISCSKAIRRYRKTCR